MATTKGTKTMVAGMTDTEETYKKHRGWFLFFPITWYELVKTETFGNDVFIETKSAIRKVFLNGKEIYKEDTTQK